MKKSLEIKTAKARKSIATQIEKAVRGELAIFEHEEYKIERDDYEHFTEINITNGSFMFSMSELNRVKAAFDKYFDKYGIRYMTMTIHAHQTMTPSLHLPVSTPCIRISVNEQYK